MTIRLYLVFDTRAESDKVLSSCLKNYMDKDEDGNDVVPGKYPNGPEWHAHHVGSVVVMQAVLDAEGVQIAPAIIDTRHHVNLLATSKVAQHLKAKVPHSCFVFPDNPRCTYQAGEKVDRSFLDPAGEEGK